MNPLKKDKLLCCRFTHLRRTDRARFIDLVARAVLPLLFFIFNIVYWSYYLVVFTENPN